MANTFSKYCIEYINSQEATLNMFNTYSLTQDLVKPLLSHRGKFVSYDHLTLPAGVSAFDRANGYAKKDISMDRVEKELTQDVGDALSIDAMDADEAQVEGKTIRLFNNYVIKNLIPSVDGYRFGAMANEEVLSRGHSSLSASTILSALLGDKAELGKKRVKFSECIIYISSSNGALLDEACIGKGWLTLGAWGGNLDAQAKMFQGAKLVEVPDDTLGEGVAWIIVHPLAVDAFVVNQDATFFETIPGYGSRKKEVDVGIYHDCFITPEGVNGIVVAYSQPSKVSLPESFSFDSASGTIEVKGVLRGAKVYYGTSTGITTSSTELSKDSSTGKYLLPSVSATTTYYVIQAVDGVASAEASVKATKN